MEVIASYHISLGKGLRSDLSQSINSPGPGAYEFLLKLSGPRAVITGRHGTRMSSLGPGPGQYNTSSRIRQTSTTFRYTMAGRHSCDAKDYGPGPGSYEAGARRLKKGIKFSRGRREALSQSYTKLVPGPGAYDSFISSSKGQRAPRYS